MKKEKLTGALCKIEKSERFSSNQMGTYMYESKLVKQLEHIHENSKACTVESSILYFAKMLSVSIVNYYLSVVIGDYNLRLVAL